MIRLALTGGIAAGKSSVTAEFVRIGAVAFSSDEAVHELYRNDHDLIRKIVSEFGPVTNSSGGNNAGEIDRSALSRALGNDTKRWRALEQIVHPAVRKLKNKFEAAAKQRGTKVIVFDIPLLFEGDTTQAQIQADYDATVVVVAPIAMRRQRAIARANMTPEKLDTILAMQTNDSTKCMRANYVITSIDEETMRKQVAALWHTLTRLIGKR